MSWRTISRDELDKMIPVNPPIVNKEMNPIAHNAGATWGIGVPNVVANHLNTLIPVGTAMIIVVAVK